MTESVELLSTKLALPRSRPSLVPRESLLARLDTGLDHKLILLSAPAGFGKTTLASAWITRPGRFGAAWVSLDAGDNDPVRFWRYVITACRQFDAAIGSSTLSLLRSPSPQQFSFETMLTTLINELAQLSQQCILVLEDYHVIANSQIHETVAFLLDHLPITLHVMMLSRSDPPLPLSRLRAGGDLLELRAAELRFSPEEAQTFLQQALPFPLTSEAITLLQDRTEGWVTGLRLAALALQGKEDLQEIEQLLVTVSGNHHHIMAYLVAEVLSAQPEPLQTFLLQTSFLARLTGSLCDALTNRNGSAYLLDRLERANLFLQPLDGAGRWYRYHALFAEAMQHEARLRFGETHLCTLYDKASLWYEEHDLLAEAIEAALCAQEFARAAALIERMGEAHRLDYASHTVRRWTERLPLDILQAHAPLCFAYAVALLYTSDPRAPATRARLLAPLEMAERSFQARGNRVGLGQALALRSQVSWWQGDLQEVWTFARQALALLPEEEIQWRGGSLLSAALEELQAGKLDMARQTILEARACLEAAGNRHAALATLLILGEVCSGQGELHQAAHFYRQVLAEAAEAGSDLFDRSGALLGLAALSYEWNELEAAEQLLEEAFAIGKRLADEELQAHGWLMQARLLYARGKINQAQHVLQALLAQTSKPLLLREVLACQARLQLSTGDLAAVQRWSSSYSARQHPLRGNASLQPRGEAAVCTQHDDNIPRAQQEREALIIARLLIAQGEARAALPLLERWQAEAHKEGRTRSELEMLLLTALVYFSLLSSQKTTRSSPGQRDSRDTRLVSGSPHLQEARRALKDALALAQPEGYQRLFLDEGEPLAALLRAVLPGVREEPLVTYGRGLLHTFALKQAGQRSSAARVPALLIEPLSRQEQRVLQLLAAGLSRPEIAQELVVSINTVKTHVAHIYRKLNVTSRKEARDAARHLPLL